MRHMHMVERVCDCCGGNTLRELWSHEFASRTRSETFLWKVRLALCTGCGFVLVSPTPCDADLTAYYADSFVCFSGQGADYSMEKRLAVIDCLAFPSEEFQRFLEIGSNAVGPFQAALRERFRDVLNVEPNQSCSCTHRSLDDVQASSCDMAAAYFVLEHVPAPGAFLSQCARALRQGGLLIIEVPNIGTYPLNPVALLLHEHLNHFSPLTLALAARPAGLELVRVCHRDCSRPYGFAAVFAKRDGAPLPLSPVEGTIALGLVGEGLAAIEAFMEQVRAARARLVAHCADGSPAVVWGANDVCLHLHNGFQLPASTILVDSNPAKRNFFESRQVLLPVEARETIRGCRLFVVCTRLHSRAISKAITEMSGRDPGDELVVLDMPDGWD